MAYLVRTSTWMHEGAGGYGRHGKVHTSDSGYWFVCVDVMAGN